MKKKIKDMTHQEKRLYVQHLSYKFHDVNYTPSTLLLEEIKNNDIKDESILKSFHELEDLEVQRYRLEDEFSATVSRDIAPLKRRFEYEQEQLRKKYQNRIQTFNRVNKLAPMSTTEQYDQERRKLLKEQADYKAQIEKAAKKPLDECNQKIYALFMRTVKQMYR